MKKALLIPILLFLIACGGIKNTQKAINLGDYSNAINKAIANLASNKSKKGHQPYILLLEEAFEKNKKRELDHIAFLEKDGNEANYEDIYKSYVNLRDIQERIKPLLPLQLVEENRTAQFVFDDYENEIVDYKEDLSEYLYDNAEHLLASAVNKQDYRTAYRDFIYLNEINPGFEDTRQKIEEAHQKGIDHVEVQLQNNSQQIIPKNLAEELLNFNTYGLNDLWTMYHNNPSPDVTYDYRLNVSFDQINISPEQLREKEIIKEKRVKDGYRYARDTDGIVLRDSLGNKIKIDRFKTVQCRFNEFTQFKAVQVTGNVVYTDLKTQQQINSYPLASEFAFEHIYANSDGDDRALDYDLSKLLERGAMPFPSDEQMVYDAGEDLKNRLKNILKQHRFN